MMTPAERRLERERNRLALAQTSLTIARDVLTNPIVDFIGGLAVLKELDRHYPNMDTAVNQGALIAICTALAVAPALQGNAGAALAAKFLK